MEYIWSNQLFLVDFDQVLYYARLLHNLKRTNGVNIQNWEISMQFYTANRYAATKSVQTTKCWGLNQDL